MADKDKEAYKKQRKLCVNLLRQKKREAIDFGSVTDNKKFWKRVVPLFSSKSKVINQIVSTEGNKLVNNELECTEIFNNFSNCIV